MNSTFSITHSHNTSTVPLSLSNFLSQLHRIHFHVDQSISSSVSAVFNQFESLSLSHLKDIVGLLKPSSWSTDVIPPRFIKEMFSIVILVILQIHNSSVASAVVPMVFKHALVQPFLKSQTLTPYVHANYRPISKPLFPSKLLEKSVLLQLQLFLNTFGIYEVF